MAYQVGSGCNLLNGPAQETLAVEPTAIAVSPAGDHLYVVRTYFAIFDIAGAGGLTPSTAAAPNGADVIEHLVIDPKLPSVMYLSGPTAGHVMALLELDSAHSSRERVRAGTARQQNSAQNSAH
jgi:hypothetical protein